MKLLDSEKIDDTGVTIGRRVQFRKIGGQIVQKPAKTYTAVYKDICGTWRQDALKTTNRREARRLALEIQQRIEAGKKRPTAHMIDLLDLIAQYQAYYKSKGLAPKSISKYDADLNKLKEFLTKERILKLPQFDDRAFFRFRQHLAESKHKQGVTYASKSVYAALTITKQLFKWAWQQKIAPDYVLASAKLPTARAKPQPCFTDEEVDKILAAAEDEDKPVFAILAFAGVRIGELEQLCWPDILLDRGELGMLHIRRGGSHDGPKDKDARFIPIHPRLRELLEKVPRTQELVFPHVTERKHLGRLKSLCKACGISTSKKLHSFRHYFGSLCANHSVAYRKALAWLGHGDSSILQLYYHLADDESESAMKSLALSKERGPR